MWSTEAKNEKGKKWIKYKIELGLILVKGIVAKWLTVRIEMCLIKRVHFLLLDSAVCIFVEYLKKAFEMSF